MPDMRDFLEKIHLHQSTEFTCGPAALLMARSVLEKGYQPSLLEELQIWREANTIFMGADHPGCGPHGLAIAAEKRGLKAEVWTYNANTLFSDWTRTPEHRKMMLAMLQRDEQEAKIQNIYCRNAWEIDELLQRVAGDEVAIILTADGIEAHWMLGVDVQDNQIVLVDPYPSPTYDMQKIIYWPVKQFDKLTRYGQHKSRAAIFLKKES